MRKSSRGASRSQRRRRSKSPILQPPKFTYCSPTAPPGGCLKHQRLAVPESAEPQPAADGRLTSSVSIPAQKELPSTAASSHISSLVFGSCAGFETQEIPAVVPSLVASSRQDGESSAESSEGSCLEKSACGGVESGVKSRPAEAADFRALSELHSSSSADRPVAPCPCTWKKSTDPQEESGQGAEPQCHCQSNQQGWAGVEVYSFTGLRNVISECERSLPSLVDPARTLSSSSNTATASSPSSLSSSGSPRSCSEQARGYVDDITIEDLSGYMEFYLYIPKKMSHMAEMMYT